MCQDPAIPCLGIYLRDKHADAPGYMYQDVDSNIVVIAQNWKQPKREPKSQMIKEGILY